MSTLLSIEAEAPVLTQPPVPPRLSLAVLPDEATLAALQDRVEQLQHARWAKEVRWLRPEQWQLTLHGFGSLEEEPRQILIERWPTLFAGIMPMVLTLGEPALFPRAARAKHIACPVEASPELRAMMRTLHAALEREGLGAAAAGPQARPHLILGRLKASCPKNVRLGGAGGMEFPVAEVHLAASSMTPQGRETVSLARAQLG